MKNIFRLILFVLFILSLGNSVYADTNHLLDGLDSYWGFNTDSSDDYQNRDFTLINSPLHTTSGCFYSGCYDMETGDNDIMTSSVSLNYDNFTIDGWVKFESVFANAGFFDFGTTSTPQANDIYLNGANSFSVYNPTNAVFINGAYTATSGSFTHVLVKREGTNTTLWINGTKVGTGTSTISLNAIDTLVLGSQSATPSSTIDGIVDEFAIWHKALNSSQIAARAAGVTLQNFDNGSLTPIITSNLSALYNTYNINISLTTNEMTNMSYLFNGGSEVAVCANCTNTSILITGVEGLNNISFKSRDSVGVEWTNQTFTIDTTNPELSVQQPIYINDYDINFNNVINSSDDNFYTCVVSIQGNTPDCNSTSYTSLYNGNVSFNVTVTDLAGNSISSLNNIIYFDPNQYFYFQLSNGSRITNFELDGITYSSYATIPVYDLGIGDISLEFTKTGYADKDVNFTTNLTSALNITTIVTNSKIILTIYNGETNNVLTGLSEVTLISSLGYSANTTTGYLNITNLNFIEEDYQIIVSHSGYTTESVYFTYTNQELLTKYVYLLNSSGTNLGTVILVVTADTGQFIENALCRALKWDTSSSSWISVSEGKTNINGQVTLNILLNVNLYKFECSKAGTTTTTSSQILSTSGTSLPIVLSTSTTSNIINYFGSLSYSFYNTTINDTHQLLRFNFTDTNNLVTQGCISTYQSTGTKRVALDSNCTSTASGSLLKIVDINNSYTLIAVASVVLGGITTELDSLTFRGTGDITYSLEQYHLDILIPLVFIIIGIVIGLAITPQNIYISIISTIVMVWLSVAFVPSVISSSIAIFVTFICGLMLYGGNK